MATSTLNIKTAREALGEAFKPHCDYQIVLGTSLQSKLTLGWKIAHEEVGELLGEPLVLLERPKQN